MSKQKSANYTEEFRKSSARLAVDSDQSISTTAINIGVNETTLYIWVSKYHPERHKDKEALDPLEELKRLRKDLKRVTMERDILKKATAYFAKETLRSMPGSRKTKAFF